VPVDVGQQSPRLVLLHFEPGPPAQVAGMVPLLHEHRLDGQRPAVTVDRQLLHVEAELVDPPDALLDALMATQPIDRPASAADLLGRVDDLLDRAAA
jgi:hypothetical protein